MTSYNLRVYQGKKLLGICYNVNDYENDRLIYELSELGLMPLLFDNEYEAYSTSKYVKWINCWYGIFKIKINKVKHRS